MSEGGCGCEKSVAITGIMRRVHAIVNGVTPFCEHKRTLTLTLATPSSYTLAPPSHPHPYPPTPSSHLTRVGREGSALRSSSILGGGRVLGGGGRVRGRVQGG